MPFDSKDPDTIAALKLAVDEAVATATAGLLSKRDELLGSTKALKDKLAEHELHATELEAKEQAAREETLKKAGKVDELLASQKTSYQKVIDTQNERNEKLINTVRDSRVNEALVKAIAAEKGVPELLLPVMKNRVKFDPATFAIEIVNADGTPMLTADGRVASVADLVIEYKSNDLYGRAFEANVGSGGGSQGDRFSGAGNTVNPFVAPKGGKVDVTAVSKYYTEMVASGKGEIAKAQAKEAGINIK